MNIQQLALEAVAAFECKKRDNGESFWCLKEPGNDSWLGELVHAAHGDMLPNDYSYDMIHSALYALAHDDADHDDMFETADGMVSVYTGDRVAWLASHGNRSWYVDEATKEYGQADSINDQIARGWFMEASEICSSVVHSLETELENRE
jgi:hypothetical protein